MEKSLLLRTLSALEILEKNKFSVSFVFLLQVERWDDGDWIQGEKPNRILRNCGNNQHFRAKYLKRVELVGSPVLNRHKGGNKWFSEIRDPFDGEKWDKPAENHKGSSLKVRLLPVKSSLPNSLTNHIGVTKPIERRYCVVTQL